MEWTNWLTERGVEIKGAAFGLASVEKSTAEHLKQAEADISQQHAGAPFHFPVDYTAFAQQIGGGSLGRVSIFCPIGRLWFADLRFHDLRLAHSFSQPDFETAHSFPMKELVVFAKDKEEDLWFAWKTSEVAKSNFVIYCFDEQPRAPPPKKVAANFTEFVQNFALRNKLDKLRLKKFSEDMKKAVDEQDDDWSDDEDEAALANDPTNPMPLFRSFANN